MTAPETWEAASNPSTKSMPTAGPLWSDVSIGRDELSMTMSNEIEDQGVDPAMHTQGLRSKTLRGLMWSMAQSWGGKALQFVLFLFLARLLTPEEFGLAVAMSTLLLLLSSIAEFGFGDALVQRRDLEKRDINLPFYSSMLVSTLFAVALMALSSKIEAWSGYSGLARLLVVAAFILPLTTASAFQEALYKRHLDFRVLALRQIVALIISGIVSIACAVAGLGALSMVIQQLVFVTVSMIWLWTRAKWLPFRDLNRQSFVSLGRYGINVVSNRLLDFFITRTVEIIIFAGYGAAGLGIYAVGARVYVTLMQLFVTAVFDVSLSALSRISHEPALMRRAYFSSMKISALLTVPVFVAVAALSREFTVLLFGAKWAEASEVMTPLMLAGAVQGVQFINGAYFAAMGRPQLTLFMNIAKFLSVVIVLKVFQMDTIGATAEFYAASLLVTTPMTFVLICRYLNVSAFDIVKTVWKFYAIACVAFVAVALARPHVAVAAPHLFQQAVVLSALFVAIYAAGVTIFSRNAIQEIRELFRK